MKKITSEPRAMTPEELDPDSLARLQAAATLQDDQINLSDPDAPEALNWTGAVRGRFCKPVKKLKSLRIDADVLAFFEAQGPGYQTRINSVLRKAMLEALKRSETGAV
jgi:uncharacterized protein (DUF4415 family)